MAHDEMSGSADAQAQQKMSGTSPRGPYAGFQSEALGDRETVEMAQQSPPKGDKDAVRRQYDPSPQRPTIGRIVRYVLSENDVSAIMRRRDDAVRNFEKHKADRLGTMIHIGNTVNVGQIVSAVVVQEWDGTRVNLKCFLDGNDDYWITGVEYSDALYADALGTWHWPSRS